VAQEDFNKSVVETIAKRAANFCSNPDCRALTCGPAENPNRTLSIGEAAHIYGARPGSARFRDTMTPKERGDITNAIWLCRNCHKLVDADAAQFPADLLFVWRREQDAFIAQQIGKRSDIIRNELISRELVLFKEESFFAQQIVIDKAPGWEYHLTVELLRSGLEPVFERWSDLEGGLYAKPLSIVPLDKISDWNKAHMLGLSILVHALSELLTKKMEEAWGAPGVSGNELKILKVCKLFIRASNGLIDWEESVRFSTLPDEFEKFKNDLQGIGAHLLREVHKAPIELARLLDDETTSGTHVISITIGLPEGWTDTVTKDLNEAVEATLCRT
jgi:hypothetical protein